MKRGLKEEFDIKDLGLATFCLGLVISQGDGEIMLNQNGYIMDTLRRFGIEDCNPIATPAELHASHKQTEEMRRTANWPCRELIGTLLYLAVATRADIANSVEAGSVHEHPRQKPLGGGQVCPEILSRHGSNGIDVHTVGPAHPRIFRYRLGG